MASYKFISNYTASGTVANITFSSIPQTYTDLLLVFAGRFSLSAQAQIVRLQFNDSSSGYSFKYLEAYGAGISAGNTFGGGAYIYGGYVNGTNATSSVFTSNTIYIPNYTSSYNKSVNIEATAESQSVTGYTNSIGGLWSNTAAITSLTLTPDTGSFTQYSTAHLYGISKA